jgi:hypothetical protein
MTGELSERVSGALAIYVDAPGGVSMQLPLEDAQELAGHADARTTRLYIGKARKLAQAEVERVQL